ncbi:MAG: trigger factor [Flavobacteriales bacterium]|jgi:trigger factor|nr:trigger factor [Flavobacteriales bacterium]MBK6551248.1 trigger factor [Flavobacteriales bacterium]MBK6884735.1 trigger factor [Flavobacteriales bacterium]MBK7102060.1 trigger factor [Flavobacteriales bacterium]MBK7114411.1 trigger factor [Flavobacteriales bacterium]
MHIEREETGNLTATLKVKLSPEDYSPGVEKALKEQRKTAVLPGFRPGQVPMSIIKKRVGRAVLVNEVERLIDANLRDYLHSNAIRVLGQPLPKNEDIPSNDWEQPGDFQFAYELGLAPSFEVDLSDRLGVEYPVAEITDELVQLEITDMQRRFGTVEDAEVSEEKDMLLGDLIELNADGSIKEGGIMNRATMSLEFIPDEASRKALTGKTKGDEVVVDPYKVSRDQEDLARMLGVDQDRVQQLEGNFLFRVAEIKRMLPVALGQELYDRVYGKDAVADEAGFRAKVKEGLENMFRRDSDRIFRRMVMKKLNENTPFELPDRFLKRWIRETSKNPVTPEQVEESYTEYANGLKRQLLEERVVEKYGLEAKGEEMDAFAKRYIVDQFMQYGMPIPEGEQLQQLTARILGDREQIGRIRGTIVEQKLITHFKALLSPKESKVSYEAFVNLAGTT